MAIRIHRFGRRRGFTLVELLVVMAVMALIASIGIYAFQPYSSHSSVNGGAQLLQSWLNTARQRALRDGAPRGIRLLQGDEISSVSMNSLITGAAATPAINSLLVTKCVFLELGEEIVGYTIYHQKFNSGADKQTINIDLVPAGVTLSGNDYIEINGGLPRRISSSSTDTTTNPNTTKVILSQSFPYQILKGASSSYRIIRPAAPLSASGQVASTNAETQVGTEEMLTMPKGSCINLEAVNVTYKAYWPKIYPSSAYPYTLNQTSLVEGSQVVDVLFAPDGSVIAGPNASQIVFWISSTATGANPNLDPYKSIISGSGATNLPLAIDATRNNPSLVVIYPKTGFVASYDIDQALGGNPFSTIVQ
jgi:prepilin-type N-terminal cleavage/methylation domain-containing protein